MGAEFLQRVAIDYDPARQSTKEFIQSIISEVSRLQTLSSPLTSKAGTEQPFLSTTQQRTQLLRGQSAIIDRIQSLGSSGAIPPGEVHKLLAQALAPIRTALANVDDATKDEQVARRFHAANIRLQATQELKASEQYMDARAKDAALIRKTDAEARAAASAMLKVDREYIAAKAAHAADEKRIAQAAKAVNLGLPDQQAAYQSRAAGGRFGPTIPAETDVNFDARIAAGEKSKAAALKAATERQLAAPGSTYVADTANAALLHESTAKRVKLAQLGLAEVAGETRTVTQARIVAAEKLQADRQKLANVRELSKLSAAEVGIQAETVVLERQRQRALNQVTQSLIRQKIQTGEISGGTTFQQLQASLASRHGGPAKLPEEYQRAGQFLSSKLLTTAGFAVSGAAAYGVLTTLKDIYKSEADIQQAFTIIDGQLNALGQGSQLPYVREQLQGIAGDTGTAEALIAQLFPQIEGAFHDTSVALGDARAASELAKITKTDLKATVDALVPASAAFGVNFRVISDAALGIQERAGVAAGRTIQLFGAMGPVATQFGLSLKQVGAIAAAVLQDTARTPQSVAEDLNRVIPQLQARTHLIYAALQQGGAKNAGEFVSDISAGKTGAALELLIADYQKLGAAQQQALVSAAGSGRGTKDVIDLLLNEKVAVNELNPALDDAGKTAQYFTALQKDLGQQAVQLKEQLLQLGRALLESGAADALQHVLAGVILLIHGLQEGANWFVKLDKASGGSAGHLLEIAAAAKALQVLLTSEKFKSIGTIVLNKLPGVNIGRGSKVPGPVGPEAQFATAVTEAGQVFLGTITKASATVEAALAAGGKSAGGSMVAGGKGAEAELIEGGAGARAEMLANPAILARNASYLAKTAPAAEGAAGAGILARLGGIEGIIAAIVGYGAFKSTSNLLGSKEHPGVLGRFELRVLNDTVGAAAHYAARGIPPTATDSAKDPFGIKDTLADLTFGGKPHESPLTPGAIDAVHAAIANLGAGLQVNAKSSLTNDEERRIAKDLKAAKSKNLTTVLKSIQDLQSIYNDLKQRDPTAAATAKYFADAGISASAPDLQVDPATGVSKLETKVQTALDGYTTGVSSFGDALSLAQDALAGLPTTNQSYIAAKKKVDKVISDQLLQNLDLVNSLQAGGPEDAKADLSRDVATFNLPEFADQAARLNLAKKIVADLKAQNKAEADAATNVDERNRLLKEGLAVPAEVRNILGKEIVDTDPLIQTFFKALANFDKNIFDSVHNSTVLLVSGSTSVGDAIVQAMQTELDFLKGELGRVPLIGDPSTGVPGIAQIQAAIAVVQGQLDKAKGARGALNAQPGVPKTANNPPPSPQDLADRQADIAKSQAALDSVAAGQDKVKQAQIAQRLAASDLKAAKASGDKKKIIDAQTAQEQANQQLAAANAEVDAANNQLQAARDANDPIRAARDAQKIADDQLAVAKSTHDTVGQINAEIAQINSGRSLASAMAELGQAQSALVRAQLEASGDVVGASKQQVVDIQRQITEFIKQHPDATLTGPNASAELNNLNAQLVGAQTNVAKTIISDTEQKIQDNLDLNRITVGQAVAQLRALEALQTNQHDRDEIEKRVRALLKQSTGDLQFNLPADIALPTLYEARRLNATAAGSTYSGGTVDNRRQTFIFEGSDLEEVKRVVATAVGSGSALYGSTSRRY